MHTEKLAELAWYTEGPVRDKSGRLFFTTLRGGMIMQREIDGDLTPWARCACPNGQWILPGGDHLVCDSQAGTVLRFDARGLPLAGLFSGAAVPNDLVADGDGNIYFTDSVRHAGRLLVIRTDGTTRVLAHRLDYPNGLAFSADEQRLYFAESYRNRILYLDLKAPDKISLLAELPRHRSGREEDNLPDGLKVDAAGNLWVAHYGMGAVQVLSQEGRLLRTIPTGLPLTSNLLLFDEKTLIVTGGYGEPGPGAVVRIQL